MKNDDILFRLDYSIRHNINNYMDGGAAKYDYIDSDIIIWNIELCYIVNTEFDLNLIPEQIEKIDKDLANNIWHYLDKRGEELHLSGLYGDNFLNNWYK